MGFQNDQIKKSPCITPAVYKCHLHMCDPEATETFQKPPTLSRSFRHIPEATEIFQKTTNTLQELPKHSTNYRSIPETTDTFQKLPKHSRNYRHIPESIPYRFRNCRHIPVTAETFQKLPLQKLPRQNTEAFKKLPKHSRREKLLMPPPPCPGAYTSMPSPLYGIPFSYRCPPACIGTDNAINAKCAGYPHMNLHINACMCRQTY